VEKLMLNLSIMAWNIGLLNNMLCKLCRVPVTPLKNVAREIKPKLNMAG
jgi:hypothetical protein